MLLHETSTELHDVDTYIGTLVKYYRSANKQFNSSNYLKNRVNTNTFNFGIKAGNMNQITKKFNIEHYVQVSTWNE